LKRELQSDLELEEEEQRERGVTPEETLYAAISAFGNPSAISEQTREVWNWRKMWESLIHPSAEIAFSDVTAAVRHSPGTFSRDRYGRLNWRSIHSLACCSAAALALDLSAYSPATTSRTPR
jgi:hypothetical protein